MSSSTAPSCGSIGQDFNLTYLRSTTEPNSLASIFFLICSCRSKSALVSGNKNPADSLNCPLLMLALRRLVRVCAVDTTPTWQVRPPYSLETRYHTPTVCSVNSQWRSHGGLGRFVQNQWKIFRVLGVTPELRLSHCALDHSHAWTLQGASLQTPAAYPLLQNLWPRHCEHAPVPSNLCPFADPIYTKKCLDLFNLLSLLLLLSLLFLPAAFNWEKKS